METATQLRVLRIPENNELPKRNRFIAQQMEVVYDKPLTEMLADANCHPYKNFDSDPIGNDTFGRHYNLGRRKVWFEILIFDGFRSWGVSKKLVLEVMKELDLRPACVEELIAFALIYKGELKTHSLIALGSSDKVMLQYKEDQKSGWKKFCEFITGRKEKIRPSYPQFESSDRNLLRLSRGEGNWKPDYCAFLGVYHPDPFEGKYINLPITKEDYERLPPGSSFTHIQLNQTLPLGTMYRAADGHVCKIVRGEEMIAEQWGAGLSIPDRGLIHYRPVFVEPDAVVTPAS